ncbi:unnamed protein product [Prunus armeniaca]|uniref:DUF4283 domain-containing protein n=1 Tax=Prunus armeniaca TaxID=36596 RepID=A0A6J5V7D4_PRUAR|nr:unnamed protein product [Prunus armeniaca]
MEPWTFRDGLVWLAEVSIGADARTVLVDMRVFLVQLHGITLLNMTMMVAKKVGALIGRVLEVDQADGVNCIGRFFRVHIRFDVGQPLMRGTFVAFPEEGSRWIDFRLEAVEDLRGRRLKGSTCRFKNSVSPRRGSGNYDLTPGSQGHRQHGGNRWGRRDGNRADQHGTWRGERVQRAELEDTAASPNKSGSRLSAVANFIRCQHDGEERNRQLREAAWEAGLIFGRGDSREGTFSHNSASNTVSFSTRHRDNLAYGLGHMQDAEAVGEGLDLNVTVDNQVLVVCGGDSVGEQVVGNIGLERPWSLTQNSDPFNLGPLIDGAQRSGEGRAKRKGTLSKGQEEAEQCRLGKRQWYGNSSVCFGVSDTSGEECINACREGCLVMGDFNDIEAAEKDGGHPRTVQSMDDFRGFVTTSNLLDLGYEGCPFTWRNRRDDGGIQGRLDRGLANDHWLRVYPEVHVVHRVAEGSNHVMLLLYTLHTSRRRASRFIFNPRWSALEKFHDLVKEQWRRGFVGLGVREYDDNKVRRLEVDLKKELQKEEEYWKLKSRVQWLCEGEKSTKFFHSKVLVQRRVNRLLGLEDPSGVWHAKAADIRRIT